MTNPTPEQLRDPAWWGANAPEGATHYRELCCYPWLKAKPAPAYFTENGWVDYQIASTGHRHVREAIPRPTKQPAPEWDGEGLPPVGSTRKDFIPSTSISAAESDNPDTKWEMVAHCDGRGVVYIEGSGKPRVALIDPQFCRKPEKRLNLGNHTFLEPMREAPEVGERYWGVDPESGSVRLQHWVNHRQDRAWLRLGLLQRTEQGAREQLAAMIASVGGEL